MVASPKLRIVTGEEASALRPDIAAPLIAFNFAAYGPSRRKAFAAVLEHPETGEIEGGLYGESSFGWMFVQLLVVPEAHRGRDIGTRLMEHAETFARDEGCRGIWLDTFDFQARGFYEKAGYSLFGELTGGNGAVTRYFMQKLI